MNDWISIKDSKPTHGETVLVVTSNGFVSQAEYRGPSQEFFEPYFGQEEMDAEILRVGTEG